MEFKSFEEALEVCMNAADNSPQQVAAMIYCLENAPPELRELLLSLNKNHAPGCGCGGHGHEKTQC
ncbi:MAG: hypothetical protein A2521_11615 [Deltaproteobacteria bacterium RIFOXYD12_FULL_57_12]|nr:MAG: hypothetical protein A2521_11615 [Deltaproteobacteria bacterium RIFOXYD12_FULL_57_12]